ncbi:hypothetical protein EDD21DRAFT_384754 [Dissophora ornata]|nr:hypothetical protein EDD21DRAFT_384754 [Dissophora ornata]
MARLTSLEDELAEEERTLRAEQEWFLTTQVKPNLQAIQKALQACQDAARLQDDTMGALTLAISSPNNDTLKGFVTLAGSFIVKGDLTIKLPKLPIVKVAIHSHVPSNATAPASSSSAAVSTAVSTAASIAATSSSASSIIAGGAIVNIDGGAEETTSSHIERTGDLNDDASQQATATANTEGPSRVLHEALGALPLSISTTASGTTSGTASGTVTPPTGGSGALAVLTAASGSLLAPTTAPLPLPANVNTLQLLHSYRPPGHLTQPYLLEQIKDVQNHTAQAIFRLEDYWSSGCDGAILRKSEQKEEKQHSHAADVLELDIKASLRPLKSLLELMQRHLRAGLEAMARPKKEKLYPFRVCDPKIFSPALSEDFVIEFYIRDSQLVCAAYALQLTGGNNNNGSGSGGNAIASYLQQAMPGAPSQASSSSASTTSGNFLDGHHHALTHTPQQYSLQMGVSGGLGGERGTKSGQATPRPTSPVMHHRRTSSQTNHQQSQQQPPHQQQQSQVGSAKAYPWSPSRSPPTPQQPHHPAAEYHSSTSVVSSPPPNESVVLPSSNKIGQTSKGGINKYRGKVATTIEDKVVQVESPKLADINARLAHAEGLCRRLLQFLVLQESCH